MDDSDPGFSVLSGPAWFQVDQEGQWGLTCRRANTDSVLSEVQWETTLPTASHEVLVWYPSLGDQSTNGAWYKIFHADGQRNRFIDQRHQGSQWVSLGTYRFTSAEPARVTLINQAEAGKQIFADAVFFRGETGPPIEPPVPAEVAPGVRHSVWSLPTPLVVNVLEFDLASPEHTIQMGFPQGRRNFSARWPTSQIASFHDQPGNDVIAAVNASFFFGGIGIAGILGSDSNVIALPTPEVIQETYVLQESAGGWGGFRVPAAVATVQFADGASREISVLNNLCEPGARALFTPDWDDSTGSTTQGVEVIIEGVNFPLRFNKEMVGVVTAVRAGSNSLDNPIPPEGFVLGACSGAEGDLLAHASVGEPVVIRLDLTPRELTNARLITNGAGWLVREGAPFQSAGDVRHPRTVIAWTGTRHWLLTFDGRQPGHSVGASVAEMVDFITGAIGAENAINLDGGGSTTMVIDGAVVNCPSDGATAPCTGTERAVANALLLVERDPQSGSPLTDVFPATGRTLPWDEKFSFNPTVEFTPPSPGGDGHVLQVLNPLGGFETASVGAGGDSDYAVEAWVFCDHRPEVAGDGFERVGIFARDDGNANFDSPDLGGGNCYAMTFDSDTGRIRAARAVGGELNDFLEADPLLAPSDQWRLFRIECTGERIRYLLDGEVIADVTDDAHGRGRAGVAHHERFGTEGVENGGRFDSFTMEPWPIGALDLSGHSLR